MSRIQKRSRIEKRAFLMQKRTQNLLQKEAGVWEQNFLMGQGNKLWCWDQLTEGPENEESGSDEVSADMIHVIIWEGSKGNTPYWQIWQKGNGDREDCPERATVTHTRGKVNLHLDYNRKRKGAKERHFKGNGVTDFIRVRGSCQTVAVKRNLGISGLITGLIKQRACPRAGP